MFCDNLRTDVKNGLHCVGELGGLSYFGIRSLFPNSVHYILFDLIRNFLRRHEEWLDRMSEMPGKYFRWCRRCSEARSWAPMQKWLALHVFTEIRRQSAWSMLPWCTPWTSPEWLRPKRSHLRIRDLLLHIGLPTQRTAACPRSYHNCWSSSESTKFLSSSLPKQRNRVPVLETLSGQVDGTSVIFSMYTSYGVWLLGDQFRAWERFWGTRVKSINVVIYLSLHMISHAISKVGGCRPLFVTIGNLHFYSKIGGHWHLAKSCWHHLLIDEKPSVWAN